MINILGKRCSGLNYCDGCTKADHRLLYEKEYRVLPDGMERGAGVDCFSVNDLTEYVYSTRREFKHCMANCKRCKDHKTCLECGRLKDNMKKFYLLVNKNPHKCVESCKLEESRFEIEDGSGIPKCMECIEGSSTPHIVEREPANKGDPKIFECVDCSNQPGYVVDLAT